MAILPDGRSSALRLKTFPAEHRPSLGRNEGDGCLLAALRADGAGLGPAGRLARGALRFAGFAAFWIVAKLLLPEKELLARSKNELTSAVHALQSPVDQIHVVVPRPVP